MHTVSVYIIHVFKNKDNRHRWTDTMPPLIATILNMTCKQIEMYW